MNKYWKLISNTLIFAIGTFSSKVLVFLLMPLYTSVLSEAEYGTVDLMVQVGNFLLPLVSCGIINGIIRFGLDKYYKKSDVFTTGFLTILGGFGILLVLEPLLCHISYLGDNTMMIYVFVLMSSMRSLCSQFVRAKGMSSCTPWMASSPLPPPSSSMYCTLWCSSGESTAIFWQ